MTPALDQFMPETTDSPVFMPETTVSPAEPISPSPLFALRFGIPRFTLRKLSWLVSMLAILFAGYSGFEGFRGAHSASEQAAGAMITLAIAVVPYLFARSVDEFSR